MDGNVRASVENGEGEDTLIEDANEKFGEEEVEEEDEEEEEGEDEEYKEVEGEEDDEEEQEEELKVLKNRKCQKRKKIKQICWSDNKFEEENDKGTDEGEDLELFLEEEGEEEECIEIDTGSYTSSVLSTITFQWENEVYEFEELCDPVSIGMIFKPVTPKEEVFQELCVKRYFEQCKSLNIYSMSRIVKSLTLEEIDLSHCNVDGKNIRALCAALEVNNTVKRLILRYNKLKEDECYCLGRLLNRNGTLSHVDFTGCRIGAESLQFLISHLSKNESLEDLILSKCKIKDEGMKMLAYVLMANNSIQKLDLSYNELGEMAGEALGAAFAVNSSVKDLILRYNNLFYPSSMELFFRSLSNNKSISNLDLSWNGLSGNVMGSYIGLFLKKSRSIRVLDLSDNRFDGAAVAEIKKGVSKAKNLETLKMGKNPMSPADINVLLSGVKGNEFLKVFDLEELWVDKTFLKILAKIQQSREIAVNYAGVFSNYQVFGPDYAEILLRRARYEAQKPKVANKKRDFGHLMWLLGDKPLTTDDFMEKVKKFKAKVDRNLYPELIKEFTIPKVQLIDVVAMRQKYLTLYPESQAASPQFKKGKEKGSVVAEEEMTKPGEDETEGEEDEEEEGELMLDFEEGEEDMEPEEWDFDDDSFSSEDDEEKNDDERERKKTV